MAHTPAPPADRSAAPDSDPAHDALMERLARAAAGYYRDLTAAAAIHGLTMTQAKMLILLRQQPLPMRALAGRLACDASNITGLVDRLEARGLVSRHADAADRRIKNVVATEEGREAVRLVRADMRATSAAFERLDEEGRRSLYELLGRLHPEETS